MIFRLQRSLRGRLLVRPGRAHAELVCFEIATLILRREDQETFAGTLDALACAVHCVHESEGLSNG